MKAQAYDLIGDIHGQHDKLMTVLRLLGYVQIGGTYRHPEGRRVVFLGDYVDRGPKVREVLQTVKGMVDAGVAVALMGNHEYNVVCYHRPKAGGGWLRERSKANTRQIEASLKAFAGREDEWAGWLQWMRQLPLFLDLGEFRAVHACWDERNVQRIGSRNFLEDAFLQASALEGTPEYEAVENLLKGPEIRLPAGFQFADHEGQLRKTTRVRWWDIPDAAQIRELTMRDAIEAEDAVDPDYLRNLPNYDRDEPPVFFGHYSMSTKRGVIPIRPNLACLDFGAGYDGPLVAYRWDG